MIIIESVLENMSHEINIKDYRSSSLTVIVLRE
jgi:hypothetical protein